MEDRSLELKLGIQNKSVVRPTFNDLTQPWYIAKWSKHWSCIAEKRSLKFSDTQSVVKEEIDTAYIIIIHDKT